MAFPTKLKPETIARHKRERAIARRESLIGRVASMRAACQREIDNAIVPELRIFPSLLNQTIFQFCLQYDGKWNRTDIAVFCTKYDF